MCSVYYVCLSVFILLCFFCVSDVVVVVFKVLLLGVSVLFFYNIFLFLLMFSFVLCFRLCYFSFIKSIYICFAFLCFVFLNSFCFVSTLSFKKNMF